MNQLRTPHTARHPADTDPCEATPWRTLTVSGHDVNPVPSMITGDESLYLHWLARYRYRGLGEIVDGGPLLGGSTVALAEGLRLNPVVSDRVARIHSYDLFEYSTTMKRVFRRRAEPDPGSSLLPEFMEHTAPWRDEIVVYPGDIRERGWTGAPIEILFIDLAKTWDIQRHLLREFFPHLIPGESVVVQQDYFFVSCYWIHLVMEYFHAYFRISAMPDGPTLAFDYVAPIPRDLLDLDFERLFTRDEAVALMDRSLERLAGSKRLSAATAKVSLLLAHGDVNEAAAVLDAIKHAPDFDDRVKIDWDKASQRVGVAMENDRRRSVSSALPREAAYAKPSWAEGAITEADARFLHDLIVETRPTMAIEVGVASGCSSAVLLRALADVESSPSQAPLLYAFDITSQCYFNPDIPTGAAVAELVPSLLSRYALRCGDSLDARELLGEQVVSFAFIDGNHYHPWPTIDLIALLPALQAGSWVVLHDIRLPDINIRSLRGYGPGYLYDHWPFEKRHGGFRDNTGAIRLPDQPSDLSALWSTLLDLPWEATPPERVLDALGISARAVSDSSRMSTLRTIERAWRRDRPLYVWGTGEAAAQLTAWLRQRGAVVTALVDRDTSRQAMRLLDLPVLDPSTVRRRTDAHPLVVVAGRFRHQIARELKSEGWRGDRDFVVL